MLSRLPLLLGAVWAAAMIAAALLLPLNGSWTIDDGVKYVAACNGTGLWADFISDGPIRSRFSDPSAFPPIHPPFASRIEGGFSFGFSPWTRAVFKIIALGGVVLWKILPALIAIAVWIVLARCGLYWAFLLLPLTFYGLVPWEHALSWLLLWPAVWLSSKQKAESRKQKQNIAERGVKPMVFGILFSFAALLRPETAILGAVLGAYLLFAKSFRGALLLGAGTVVGLGGMLLWHSTTSSQPALAQISLNIARAVEGGFGDWLANRPAAIYALLLHMDLSVWASVALIACFVAGVALLWFAQKRKSKTLLSLALGILAAWIAFYQYRLWSAVLPSLALMSANSLFACLPWIALLVLPPYRDRPAFLLAVSAIIVAVLTAPVWAGVHWGPRILLFVVPLLALDLYRSGRARGWAFHALLILTAAQTLGSAALVYARSSEMSDRFRLGASKLGNPVICPTMSQCADFAPLWKDHEFFTASAPEELRQLLIEFRFAKLDTVWLHLDALDPLYIKTFPDAKPVWPHRMTVFKAGTLYQTQWRIYELVMNRSDSLWAGILEAEAGRLMGNRQPEVALKLEREAVVVAPGSAQVRNNLALILASLGDTSAACEQATIALRLNPDLKEPRRLLEMLHSRTTTAP